MTWGNSDPWCLPYTAEMVRAFSGYGVEEQLRCPGCGAILNSFNTEGICSPCFINLHDLSMKFNPSVIVYVRKNNPELYQEVMTAKASMLAKKSGILL